VSNILGSSQEVGVEGATRKRSERERLVERPQCVTTELSKDFRAELVLLPLVLMMWSVDLYGTDHLPRGLHGARRAALRGKGRTEQRLRLRLISSNEAGPSTLRSMTGPTSLPPAYHLEPRRRARGDGWELSVVIG
jgi:hypothetical protein